MSRLRYAQDNAAAVATCCGASIWSCRCQRKAGRPRVKVEPKNAEEAPKRCLCGCGALGAAARLVYRGGSWRCLSSAVELGL